jgi:hypothetical protein
VIDLEAHYDSDSGSKRKKIRAEFEAECLFVQVGATCSFLLKTNAIAGYLEIS